MASSKRSRGRAFEMWVRDYLQEKGWAVHVCGRKAIMIVPGKLITKGDDIFGADCIALKSDQRTLFIQASLEGSKKKRADKFAEFPWNFEHQQVQLWQKKPSGDIVIQEFYGTAFFEVGKIIRRKFYSLSTFHAEP